MSVRFQIASMVFMMVQAVLFGIGVVTILATPLLADTMMTAMPLMIAATVLISAPVAWLIAPRLRARYWRERHVQGDVLSG